MQFGSAWVYQRHHESSLVKQELLVAAVLGHGLSSLYCGTLATSGEFMDK